MSTRPRDRVLDLRLPCAYCAGNRTAETLKVHNERCAAHGERSYAPFLKAATLGFLAGLCFVVGCAGGPTAPLPCTMERAARYGMVDTIGYTIRANGDTLVALACTCDPRIVINGA